MTELERELPGPSAAQGERAGEVRAPGPRRPRLGETARRVLTAAPFVPALLWLIFAAPPLGLAVWNALGAAVCARELLGLVSLGRLHAWAGATVTGAICLMLGNPLPSVARLALGALAVAATVAAVLPRVADVARTTRLLAIAGGTLYIGVPLALLARAHAAPDGAYYVLFATLTAFIADTGAYFGGRAFGRTKLAPRLSPGKTREGALVGLLAGASSGAAVLVFGTHASPAMAGLAALGCTACGQCGDLLESAIKRTFGARDSGALLPGHGGLLDRLDAVLATSVFTYFITSGASP